MLRINEWLPNPTGTDTTSEWIELVNSGETPILTGGYKLQAGKKVIALPSYTLQPNEYLVLPRTQTKLTLKNTDEVVLLYNPAGHVIDQSTFIGSAPEGKSFSRTGERFLFADPTPGKQNAMPNLAPLALHYPTGVPLNPQQSSYVWIPLGLCVGIGLAVAIMTIISRNEALSNLISQGNSGSRTPNR